METLQSTNTQSLRRTRDIEAARVPEVRPSTSPSAESNARRAPDTRRDAEPRLPPDDGVSVSISSEARRLFARSRTDVAGEPIASSSAPDRAPPDRPELAGGIDPKPARTRDASADSDRPGVARQDERDAEKVRLSELFPRSSRLLAVRVGPAPIEELASFSETEIAAGLDERARLRRVDQVLSLPDPAVSERDERRERESNAAEPGAERPVLSGLESRDSAELGRVGAAFERVNAGGSRRAEPFTGIGLRTRAAGVLGESRGPETTGVRLERAAFEEAVRPELTPQALGRATSVAPQAGAVSEPKDAGREQSATASESVSRNAVSEDAEAQLSQAGAVESRAADAIVTRFLGNVETEDAGPVPRPAEVLGERIPV